MGNCNCTNSIAVLMVACWAFHTARFSYEAFHTIFLIGTVLILLIIVITFTTVTYYYAFKWLHSKTKVLPQQTENERKWELYNREKRVLLMFGLMTTLYIIVFLPTIIITFFDEFRKTLGEIIVIDFIGWLYLMASVFNPCITLKLRFQVSFQKNSEKLLQRESTLIDNYHCPHKRYHCKKYNE